MQILGFLLGLALSLVSAGVQANIYGFVDEHGVAHLATEKVDARYKLFARGDALQSSSAQVMTPKDATCCAICPAIPI